MVKEIILLLINLLNHYLYNHSISFTSQIIMKWPSSCSSLIYKKVMIFCVCVLISDIMLYWWYRYWVSEIKSESLEDSQVSVLIVLIVLCGITNAFICFTLDPFPIFKNRDLEVEFKSEGKISQFNFTDQGKKKGLGLHVLLKKTIVKVVKTYFIQELLQHGERLLNKELGLISSTIRKKMGIYLRDRVWSVDGTFLRENMGDWEFRLN